MCRLISIIFLCLVGCGEQPFIQAGKYDTKIYVASDDWQTADHTGEYMEDVCVIGVEESVYSIEHCTTSKLFGAEQEGKIIFYHQRGDNKYDCPMFDEFYIELTPNKKGNAFEANSFVSVDLGTKAPDGTCNVTTWYTFYQLSGTKQK